MDSLDPILTSFLDSLAKNCGCKGWNINRENSGLICLKIRFDDRHAGSQVIIPSGKNKRNYRRAAAWRSSLENDCESKKSAKRSRTDTSPKSNEDIELPRDLCYDSVIEPVPCLHTSKVHSVSSEGTCEFLNCESDAEPPVLSQPEATVSTNSTPVQPEIKAIPHSTPIQPETKTTPDPILPITPRSNLEKCPEIDDTLDCDSCDNDSNFDDSATYLDIFPRLRGPCDKAGCFYRENFENSEFDEMNKLGHRANGKDGIIFENFYHCDLCGIRMCNNCTWIKRRHIHHAKHVKCHFKTHPPEPIDVYNVTNGIH